MVAADNRLLAPAAGMRLQGTTCQKTSAHKDRDAQSLTKSCRIGIYQNHETHRTKLASAHGLILFSTLRDSGMSDLAICRANGTSMEWNIVIAPSIRILVYF